VKDLFRTAIEVAARLDMKNLHACARAKADRTMAGVISRWQSNRPEQVGLRPQGEQLRADQRISTAGCSRF
jgi:hypothetical protein